ncbi:MAG: hypothetical protein KAR79_01450, partial [Simkaniaceae bacterium]|nr:hypothetical protein [Simkaniaceae bacterium]
MAQAITTKESEFIANAFLMSTEEQPEEKLDVLAQQFFQDLSQDVRHSSSDQVILLLCQKDGYLQKNPLLGAFLIQKIHEIAGEPKQVDTGATSVHQHFLATASHELKTPLQGLLGAAEIALEIACYGHCARDSMIDLLEKFLPQIQDPILQPDAQDLLKQCAAIRERISEKAEDSLKTIIECADQLNRIINDILNITQMQR